jgi:hypothetical protein
MFVVTNVQSKAGGLNGWKFVLERIPVSKRHQEAARALVTRLVGGVRQSRKTSFLSTIRLRIPSVNVMSLPHMASVRDALRVDDGDDDDTEALEYIAEALDENGPDDKGNDKHKGDSHGDHVDEDEDEKTALRLSMLHSLREAPVQLDERHFPTKVLTKEQVEVLKFLRSEEKEANDAAITATAGTVQLQTPSQSPAQTPSRGPKSAASGFAAAEKQATPPSSSSGKVKSPLAPLVVPSSSSTKSKSSSKSMKSPGSALALTPQKSLKSPASASSRGKVKPSLSVPGKTPPATPVQKATSASSKKDDVSDGAGADAASSLKVIVNSDDAPPLSPLLSPLTPVASTGKLNELGSAPATPATATRVGTALSATSAPRTRSRASDVRDRLAAGNLYKASSPGAVHISRVTGGPVSQSLWMVPEELGHANANYHIDFKLAPAFSDRSLFNPENVPKMSGKRIKNRNIDCIFIFQDLITSRTVFVIPTHDMSIR